MVVALADGTADLARHRVTRGGRVVALSTREAELLAYLVRADRLVTRAELLTEVWRYRSTHPTRAVDMCVRRLRAKIERDPTLPVHVITVLNEGYRFVPPEGGPAAALTRFFGREGALAELRAELSDARLVTLLGGAGMGKTRIAREVCASWDGPTRFVDLAGASDADGLVAAVSSALRSPDAQRIGQALEAAGGVLLVLDNFEQLVAAAPLVVRWLEQAPRARALVTSRTRLGVGGERLVALPPLERSAAVALFRDRAAAIGAKDLDEALTARIVDRLDGVPLALELAARRLRMLSLAQLADRLDSHLGALVSASGDRHGTMRAAIAWSWELLAPPLREMLTALSVFRAGFDLDAVEAVISPGADERLAELADHSLVQVESGAGARRYRLLESVRELAAERLSPEAGAALRERHLTHFTTLGDDLLARLPMAEALRRLESVRAELVTAWAHATDAAGRGAVAAPLCELLARRGPASQLARVLDVTLAHPMPAGVTARLLVIAGHYEVFARDFDDARHRLEAAMPLLGEAGRGIRGDAADLEARLLAASGDLDGAAAAMVASRAHFEAAGLPGRAAWVALHAALLAERIGDERHDRDVVARGHDDAERELRSVGDIAGLRLIDACRARWALGGGDAAGARYWMERAAWRPDAGSGDAAGTMEAAVVALVEEALGRWDRALLAARHRSEARRAYAPPLRLASARMREIPLLAALGRWDEAVTEARACLALALASGGDPRLVGAVRGRLGAALLEGGDAAAALAELRAARTSLAPGAGLGAVELWTGLALIELGRDDEGREALTEGVRSLADAGEHVLSAVGAGADRDPDHPDALRAYVDRRAVASRADAELARRAWRRIRARNGA